jgi:hypothetical protein
MLPHKPEQWPSLFEECLNAGDLDAAVALCEPGASFVPKSGEPIIGHDGIRLMLSDLIARKTEELTAAREATGRQTELAPVGRPPETVVGHQGRGAAL